MAGLVSINAAGARGYGRNGGFAVREIELWSDELGRAVIDVFSARRGDTPPLCLKLERPDVAVIREAVARAEAEGAPQTVRLPHPSPARGRNGWFNATALYINPSGAGAGVTFEVSAFSQRRGDQSPWSLFLSPADLHNLLDQLDNLLR